MRSVLRKTEWRLNLNEKSLCHNKIISILGWIFSNCACVDCWLTSKARRAGNDLASSRSPVTSIDARCPLPVHLLPPLFSHSTPSKRSVDSTSPNQRPVRRLSGLLSRGRSNLATSLRQTDEKPDKSTISLILFSHICTRIFSFSLFPSFPVFLSLFYTHTYILFTRSLLHFAFPSLPPVPPRWTTSNRVDTLIARELGTLIE